MDGLYRAVEFPPSRRANNPPPPLRFEARWQILNKKIFLKSIFIIIWLGNEAARRIDMENNRKMKVTCICRLGRRRIKYAYNV